MASLSFRVPLLQVRQLQVVGVQHRGRSLQAASTSNAMPSGGARHSASSSAQGGALSAGLSIAPVATRGDQVHTLDGDVIAAHVKRHNHLQMWEGARGSERERKGGRGGEAVAPTGIAAYGIGGSDAADSNGAGLGSFDQELDHAVQQRPRRFRRYARTVANSPPLGCPFTKATGRHLSSDGAPSGCPMMKGIKTAAASANVELASSSASVAHQPAHRFTMELPGGDLLHIPTESRE